MPDVRPALLVVAAAAIASATLVAVDLTSDGGSETRAAETTTTATSQPLAATTVTTAAAAAPAQPEAGTTLARWMSLAQALAPVRLPSDCPLPLGEPASLPNSERDYRGGVHQGIDFICGARGRSAVAAMEGRVLMAHDTFMDPTPADRNAVLATARTLGRTPPWTLAFLFGRFVVLDHGVLPGVGHVVTIYAHLEQLDSAIRPGVLVHSGGRIGEIGNRGTETAARGGTRARAIHLHWELHVDEVFLGAGLGAQDTAEVYRTLFAVGS